MFAFILALMQIMAAQTHGAGGPRQSAEPASAPVSPAAPGSVVIGDVRVQILSPTLVRLEQKGPRGFEDRATFHVVERRWSGVTPTREDVGDTIKLITPRFVVLARKNAKTLADVRIETTAGATLYEFAGELPNSVWLPQPREVPTRWVFADSPRLAPPAWGLAPAPAGSQNEPLHGWDTANDAPDVYVFVPTADYRQLRAEILRLTGPIPMPPMYAFGQIDSRYHAYSEATALEQVDAYRTKNIPLDVLVVDTDWRIGASHGYAPDTKYFPDMPRFIKQAHDRHVRLMFNDHPEPQSKGALDAKELSYRFDGLGGLLSLGLDAWWYDRNWHVSLADPAPNLRHEVWGMRLYHDVTRHVYPLRRPLIMSNVDGIDNGRRNRPPNIAAHRFPIQWTGDTSATWDFLKKGVENAVFCGVRGLNPYLSEDLGGHAGTPTTELYIRFMQFGALSPIMRPHCTKGQVRHPWAYGDLAERVVRDYAALRYRLLPVLYAAAREAYESGEPLLRRLDLQYAHVPESVLDNEYLLGGGLLVAPIIDSMEHLPVPHDMLKTTDGKPGLTGEYFAAIKPEGEPAFKRIDPMLNFRWGGDSPGPNVPTDKFSCRWTGKLGPIPAAPAYRLAITGDDGTRVWLDGALAVDKWDMQDNLTHEVSTPLVAGKTYDIRVEHFDGGGGATCALVWTPLVEPKLDKRSVWIPPGKWTNAWTGEIADGPQMLIVAATMEQTPMFIRSGTILPMAPNMQYTDQKPWSPLTLEVFPVEEAQTEVMLYEDDGMSNDYATDASRGAAPTAYRKTLLSSEIDAGTRKVLVHVAPAVGTYTGAVREREWVVRVRRPAEFNTTAKAIAVTVDGATVDVWKWLPRAASGMCLTGDGPATDGDLVQVRLPAKPVSGSRTVEVEFGN